MINYTLNKPENFEHAVANLYEIVSHLRSEDGCPWDREQTPKTVSGAIVDETYEYIDAILQHDSNLCSEEIGDVLLNVVMALRIHEEQEDFSPIEAIHQVCEKLIRRHPHVFSNATAANSDEVLDLWNKVKSDVEGKVADKENLFSRIPSSLPELESAYEIQKSMKKVGFDWPDVEGVIEKIEEELDEVKEALQLIKEDKEHVEEEIGDLLFSVVNLARYVKVNPSIALRRCNNKVKNRFNSTAKVAHDKQIPLDFDHAEELNIIWEKVKQEE